MNYPSSCVNPTDANQAWRPSGDTWINIVIGTSAIIIASAQLFLAARNFYADRN
ncbi:hypothetical protein DE146DRAFT_753182 [Phaeosphaeria sp. MPI-PUGE-AT-0046c]|nr:hypothetical protein DE146DRAFT_753182 [Phaeosphaeria sp. MPI-PUGE-AT-0046c]